MGLFSTKGSESDNELATNFYFPTSKNALIIFARNPELGKCKTRLAKVIGNEAALEIYKYLLNHTAEISEKIKADKFVFYSDDIKKEDLWSKDIFRKKLQYGTDLGARMENAFTELFQLNYEKVIIIGSDLLDLNTKHVDDAFQLLETNELVIGPAKDGGYYLLGMKTLHLNVFKNKDWGTSREEQWGKENIENAEVVRDSSTFDYIFKHKTSYFNY